MFLGGAPANNWDLQCRERRILESRISSLQLLGVCWGGKISVGGLGAQGGSVRSQLAELAVLYRWGRCWPCRREMCREHSP